MKTRVCAKCGKTFTVANKRVVMTTCIECQQQKDNAKSVWRSDLYSGVSLLKRKCHDCGKPTADYRCKSCRDKWLSAHGVQIMPGEEVDEDCFV